MKKLVLLRRSSQLIFLSLFVYILWSTTYPMTGIFPPATFFSLDPLLVMMTSISERVIVAGFLYSLGMLALAAVFGRLFCGWVCPIGACVDMAGTTQRRKAVLSDEHNSLISKPKFYILTLILVIAIYGRQIAWVMDPIALAGRFVSLNLIPATTFILNKIFAILIRDMGMTGAVRDLYHSLKPTFLGVKAYYFSNAGIVLIYFIAVAGASLILRRLWCRMLCPLGALYALAGSAAPFKRIVDKCLLCENCGNECRMGAIRRDMSYVRGECVLCMDCVYRCPARGVRFGFGLPRPAEEAPGRDAISRGQFLSFLTASAASFISIPFLKADPAEASETDDARRVGIIRPPAALEEIDFKDRCVRCGNCMKVCVTNGLQPVMLEAGYSGIWTPRLMPNIGYCEYKCTLCGKTCPTGAIPPLTLERKMRTRLGVAEVDKSKCLPWAEGKECIVCQEHCPVAEKAIALDVDPVSGLQKPRIVEELCVGCGICQNKCPVRPLRAVTVSPRVSDRTRV